MNDLINEIVAELTARVKTQRGIKQIYNGDPALIPRNSLPALIVDNPIVNINKADTVNDQNDYTVTISLVYSALDNLNENTSAPSTAEMQNIMKEENADGTIKDDTVLGVVRKVIYDKTFTKNILNDNIQFGARGTDFVRNYPTLEAIYTFNFEGVLYCRK